MKGRRHVGGLALGALLLAVTPAPAQERALNERHPVRLGDAFPVGHDDISLLAAGTVIVPRDGSPRGTLPLDLQYGVLTNAQLSLSTQASTTRVDDPASGDLTLAGRVGFTTESVMLPFVATQLAVTAPTGAGARAVDLELKGYASRELTLGVLQVFLHLNAAADIRASHLGEGERRLLYHLAAGPSFALPHHATTTLVADVFVDQARKRGDATTIGFELGGRQRLTPWLALDVGVGTEVIGPGDRALFFATVGLSATFSAAGR